MKKYFRLLLLIISFTSCNHNIEKSDIAKINGYWEIEKVVLKNGDKKEYKMNETIDYFEIKNSKGIRKKVMPQFDGKYLVNNQYQKIKILYKQDQPFIEYYSDFGNLEEQILELTENKLVLENKQIGTFSYKKQIPFSIK